MAQTGQPGGRQSLENTRTHGDIHSKPPSVETAPQSDLIANASSRGGKPNTNRIGSPDRVPETQKDFPESGRVSYPQGRPNTNRNR